MSWATTWTGPLQDYLQPYDPLIGDQRTRVTFRAIIKGILSGGRLICQQIARHAPELAQSRYGAQRVIRFVQGESTQRSALDADHLTAKLRERALQQWNAREPDEGEAEEELWLIMDESDLRKPYAQEMADLMWVRDLDGDLVPGYRTLNVLSVTPGWRGLLYHRLFSSQETSFVSEPHEVQRALQTVSASLEHVSREPVVSWVLDRGFDDVAVWRTIWEQEAHMVCRISHTERLVAYQDEQGGWQEGSIEAARAHLRPMAKTRSRMKLRLGVQKRPKRQTVRVEIRTCPLRLSYDGNVRRAGAKAPKRQALWLVEVRLVKAQREPWLLVTDRPVENEAMAEQIFRMYRQRWAIEDAFKYTKDCLGWEAVQVLDLKAIRGLVALAWVAAGFLYEMGVTLEWPEIQLLGRLGGWDGRVDRPPGQTVITRGLQEMIHSLITYAMLKDYIAQHGGLPPGLSALIRDFTNADL